MIKETEAKGREAKVMEWKDFEAESREQITLTVDPGDPKEPLGDLYGIFFEDINHAADGGLYAELVRNGNFEFSPIDNGSYRSLTAWEKVEEDGRADWMTASKDPVSPRNPHYLVLNVTRPGERVGVRNTGFYGGMALEAGKEYFFSCFARACGAGCAVGRENRQEAEGNRSGMMSLKAVLTAPGGKVLCGESFQVSGDWKRYELVLVPGEDELHGRLELWVQGTMMVELDLVSLMPADTFLGRKRGMRRDIAQMLADLKPRFMRFPGGCLVHDGSLEADRPDSMYRWKNTVGDPADRPGRRNNWGYHQSYGIGFYEYFQFCEDIGAKPLPVLPAGYNPHSGEAAPITSSDLSRAFKIAPGAFADFPDASKVFSETGEIPAKEERTEGLYGWVQDALDLIEFANGDKDTVWGGLRARMGHPEPFGLEYLAIGNEEAGEPFWERYALFHRVIKAVHPEIRLINSAGPFCAGTEYERGWASARREGSDLVDEHYYQAPEWFIANHHHYDSRQEKAKVFLGEYASCGNTWYNALAEASYMTGLERNASAVGLACYAPLLCNAAYVNWRPDLIWFDNQRVFGSANYYVQKLFMNHQGDFHLDCRAEGIEKGIPLELYPDRYAGRIILSGYRDAETCFRDVVLENLDTGEILTKTRAVSHIGEKYELGEFDWKNFRLSFRAVQPGAGAGLDLFLGYLDDRNHFVLNFGGWANQDLFFTHRINGAGSTLDQTPFHMEADREYEIQAEVHGRRITVFIDGRKRMERGCPPMTEESLYYAASLTETGDVIVKLVNVTKKDRKVKLCLKGERSFQKAVVYCMEGFGDEDENSFEEPLKVSPVRREHEAVENELDFVMPGRSLRVLVLSGV